MHIELDSIVQGKNRISAYAPGMVQVNEQVLYRSCIVTPDRLLETWPPEPPESFQGITLSHIQEIRKLEPELVLLGSGSRLQVPAPELLLPLFEAGIGFEAMDTGAACRSYNVLMNEGRKVAAALLIQPAKLP